MNARLMARAQKGAFFMHCLPARRGEEVTDDVIDGPQSVVVQQAANRMHVQKGILAWLLATQGERNPAAGFELALEALRSWKPNPCHVRPDNRRPTRTPPHPNQTPLYAPAPGSVLIRPAARPCSAGRRRTRCLHG